MINIERLGVLLDRGEAVHSAAVQMRKTLTEKEAEMREARVDLEQAEAAVTRYRGPESGMATLVTRVNTKRTKCDVLAASIARHQRPHAELHTHEDS